jgi:hypothetical protein
MYVWLVCFVVLFGLAELYPWVQGVVLPFPLMLLAGVGLAIASNLSASHLSASHLSGSNLNQQGGLSEPSTPPPQVPAPAVPSPHSQTLPQALTTSPPPDTISFTIRKP